MDDVGAILETETNPHFFDNKINPTKIVEKGWEDRYKLTQLIR